MMLRRPIELMRGIGRWYSDNGEEEISGGEWVTVTVLLNLHGLVDFLQGRAGNCGSTFAASVNDLVNMG